MGAHASNVRLSGLSIRRPAKTEAANGLYANGRHQCEVIIDVFKEARSSDDVWVSARLTDEERASVTVVAWSEHGNQALTRGWSCDQDRNEYSLGLWQRGVSEALQCTDVAECRSDANRESISRYLRCGPDAPIGPEVFMAYMVVEGNTYTSHGFGSGLGFESTVTINPVGPFELDAADLELYMDDRAYVAGNPYQTEVHVYYWTPPSGMWFEKNMGFDEPLGLPSEGPGFQSTMCINNPLDNRYTNIVGTLVNKNDPEASLYLDEIRTGIAGPSPNPRVRFNEEPTIMRAIRLKSAEIVQNRNTKSFWRLLDNYGTEQKFLLSAVGMELPGLPYLILTGSLVQDDIRLVEFEITLPNGGVLTNELYANDRHQCKVVVEVTAEKRQSDGNWAPIRLTADQRSSVTVTRYSTNINEPLPPGWRCDRDKNIYDTGLWRGGVEEVEPAENPVAEGRRLKIQKEIVDRYMRFEPNRPIEDVRFMAVIILGGVKYTTNYSVGDTPFNSYISIRPMRPYRLLVGQLSLHTDIDAYSGDSCDIDVYYWKPPYGLEFLVNKGLDAPLSPPGEGSSFKTYYVHQNEREFFKAGVVVNKDVENPSVLVADIFTWPPGAYQKFVRFNQSSTIMRAVRCRGSYNLGFEGDSGTRWRLWDNFGCEHTYGFAKVDSGNVIRLIDV